MKRTVDSAREYSPSGWRDPVAKRKRKRKKKRGRRKKRWRKNSRKDERQRERERERDREREKSLREEDSADRAGCENVAIAVAISISPVSTASA